MSITPGSNRPLNTEHPTDSEVQVGVRAELDADQHVDATRIDVAVDHQIVHLDGEVHDAAEDGNARSATVRVDGVLGIIDRLRPTLPPVSIEHALPNASTAGAAER